MKPPTVIRLRGRLYPCAQAEAIWAFDGHRLGVPIGAETYFSAEDLDQHFLRWPEIRAIWPVQWGECTYAALFQRWLSAIAELEDFRSQVAVQLAEERRVAEVAPKLQLLAGFGLLWRPISESEANCPFEQRFSTEDELVQLLAREWRRLPDFIHDVHRWSLAVARHPTLQAAALAHYL